MLTRTAVPSSSLGTAVFCFTKGGLFENNRKPTSGLFCKVKVFQKLRDLFFQTKEPTGRMRPNQTVIATSDADYLDPLSDQQRLGGVVPAAERRKK